MATSESRPKRREVILALDLATKCGWAVLDGKKLVASGRWNTYPSAKKHRATRWLTLEREVREVVQKYGVTVVAYERVRRHAGVGAAHVYGGLLASLERLNFEWTEDEERLAPVLVPLEVSQWRKTAIGRGNATKQEVCKWVHRSFRLKAKTEDEAEAVAIGEACRRIRAEEEQK